MNDTAKKTIVGIGIGAAMVAGAMAPIIPPEPLSIDEYNNLITVTNYEINELNESNLVIANPEFIDGKLSLDSIATAIQSRPITEEEVILSADDIKTPTEYEQFRNDVLDRATNKTSILDEVIN